MIVPPLLQWIDEKGIVQTARKGGNVDINIIENDHYKTLLPEYYLRPYSPHYISENDFDNELKQIDNSIRRLLNEIS